MLPSQESLDAADCVVKTLNELGHTNYGKHRNRIAKELFDESLWQGNSVAILDLSNTDPILKGLKIIQKDAYDQDTP